MSTPPPDLSYWTVQPSRWTFAATKIRSWVEEKMEGRVLNACCGVTELDHDGAIVRNDLQQRIKCNGEFYGTNADTHLDVRSLTAHYAPDSFDTIVYDPPFSDGQADLSYNLAGGTPNAGAVASEFDTLLKPNGKLIACGFGTSPLPPEYNYRPTDIALWNLLGRQDDWFGTCLQAPAPGDPRTTDPSHEEYHHEAIANPLETLPGLAETNVSGGGNDGETIPLSYIQLPPDQSLSYSTAKRATDPLRGHLLVIGTDIDHYAQVYDGPLTLNTPDTTHHSAMGYAIQQLAEAYEPGMFDHIILDLPPSATSENIEWDGRNTGFDTVAKAQANELISEGGTISSIGHSATLMSKLTYDRYTRHRITILSHPDAAKDTIISTDRCTAGDVQFPVKATETTAQPMLPPSDIKVHPEISTAEANYLCETCHESWHRHPAFEVDCLHCGARPGNYCVDDADSPMAYIHAHRVATWQQQHIATHGTHPLAAKADLDASKQFGSVPSDDQKRLASFQ